MYVNNKGGPELNRAMKESLLFALALLLVSCGGPANPVVGKGEAFPVMKLHDLAGNIAYSRELFSGKVVVFNVWATWCPPCRREIPDLLRLSRILPKKRFMVVALSVDERLEDVISFVHENGLSFPVYWDRGGALIATAKLGVSKYPETFVLNREGKVITRVIGAYPWAGEETIRALKYIARHGDVPEQ